MPPPLLPAVQDMQSSAAKLETSNRSPDTCLRFMSLYGAAQGPQTRIAALIEDFWCGLLSLKILLTFGSWFLRAIPFWLVLTPLMLGELLLQGFRLGSFGLGLLNFAILWVGSSRVLGLRRWRLCGRSRRETMLGSPLRIFALGVCFLLSSNFCACIRALRVRVLDFRTWQSTCMLRFASCGGADTAVSANRTHKT